jgi:hypothetical protein
VLASRIDDQAYLTDSLAGAGIDVNVMMRCRPPSGAPPGVSAACRAPSLSVNADVLAPRAEDQNHPGSPRKNRGRAMTGGSASRLDDLQRVLTSAVDNVLVWRLSTPVPQGTDPPT